MKTTKKLLSWLLVLTMIFVLAVPALAEGESKLPFSDIADSGHKDNIISASELGFVKGYGDGTFGPNDRVTRAQFITMLWRVAGEPDLSEEVEISFKDVPADSYYYKAVAWGVSAEIVGGYNETTFGPQDSINRQQMATFCYRYALLIRGPLGEDAAVSAGFKDEAAISSEEMVDAVNAMANMGILTGHADGKFYPRDGATRGQVATVLMRVYDKINLVIWDGTVAESVPTDGNTVTVSEAAELAYVFKNINDFDGKTVEITSNINLGGEPWVTCDMQGAKTVVINGNGHIIYNLKYEGTKAGLVANMWAGAKLTINDLAIIGAEITSTTETGAAVFVGYVDNATINLNGCAAIYASVKGEKWVGSFVGYATHAYTDAAHPEGDYVGGTNIKECEALFVDLSGYTAGGIVGHSGGGSAEHAVNIDDVLVGYCTITGAKRAGSVLGCNSGYAVITYSADYVAENTVTATYANGIYGQAASGTLIVNGTTVTNA